MSDSSSSPTPASCAGLFHCTDNNNQDFHYLSEEDEVIVCDRHPCPHRFDDTISRLTEVLERFDDCKAITRPPSTRATPITIDDQLPTSSHNTPPPIEETLPISPLAEHFSNLDLDPDPLFYELPSTSALAEEAEYPCTAPNPSPAPRTASPQPIRDQPKEMDVQAQINALVGAVQSLVQQMANSGTSQGVVQVNAALKPKEPESFSGDKSKYENWKNEMMICVNGASLNETIRYVLSFIRGNKAIDQWKRAFRMANCTVAPGATSPAWTFQNVEEFWNALDKVFLDPNTRRRAFNDLTALSQGSNTAQDFFVEFEQLVAAAGLQTTEPSVIEMALQKV